jgi:hypothetical protein
MGIRLKQNKNSAAQTEFSIQKILVRHYMSGAKYMVPNMYYGLGEMDMFLLRRSGYVEEFEIKCSTSDLRADFKKRKHSHFAQVYCTGKPLKCQIPNRFSYVLGQNVSWVKDWFPEYAGLYVVHNYYLQCLITPKLMHKQKYNWHEKVAGSCSHRLLKTLKLRNY